MTRTCSSCSSQYGGRRSGESNILSHFGSPLPTLPTTVTTKFITYHCHDLRKILSIDVKQENLGGMAIGGYGVVG